MKTRRTIRERVQSLSDICHFEGVHLFHPYTIVQVSIQLRKGSDIYVYATGVARCSPLDKFDADRGKEIAKYRAVKALLYKLRGRKISHPYMG